jgi:hypothetical protein
MEYSLKQQLDLANLSISELQNALDNSETERVLDLTTMVNRLQENIDSLTRRDRTLEQQLANEQQHNELLGGSLDLKTYTFVNILYFSRVPSSRVDDTTCFKQSNIINERFLLE